MPVSNTSNANQAEAPVPLVNLVQGQAPGTAQEQPLVAPNAIILARALKPSVQPLGQLGTAMLTAANYGSADDLERAFRQARGFSDQYRGDVFNDRNMSLNIPANENTSLWIEGLPAGSTTQLLLGAVAHVGSTGKIWASYINPANAADNKPYAAAKIVFFSREGAEGLLRASHTGRFLVGGRRPRVTWNRVKTASRGARDSQKSRVVLIRGPAEYVNQPRLSQWFRGFFSFETEVVITRDYWVNERGQAMQLLEWRFASTRCQGEAASMAIGLELRGMVECRYG
ncbi:uncharacterized protein GLRG_02722 [Colletotrichum graminicola M1.001]|uniref:RRM domain-containing protein n=1 Tax=Colletotrichum graminicola (strain M1.001 / M2 / FGSC 10212) TaxID=645133 RepID=E3Q9P0_COLGM|nr:uncharacterized protein GLRG_02722 [Colletotrichum graminicola M1.001]EFQ27578.1 hypothetical protein GLRG_02722 [Colletotrichum graminicola M1.001]